MTEETKIFVKKEIKTVFVDMQQEQEDRWQHFRDEIIDKIKPQFTSAQLTGFLITLLAMMVGAIIYVESIKQQSQNTKEQLEKHEILKQIESKEMSVKMDKIYDLALETNKSVAVLESGGVIKRK
jgi:hypothetical protein